MIHRVYSNNYYKVYIAFYQQLSSLKKNNNNINDKKVLWNLRTVGGIGKYTHPYIYIYIPT